MNKKERELLRKLITGFWDPKIMADLGIATLSELHSRCCHFLSPYALIIEVEGAVVKNCRFIGETVKDVQFP